MTKKVETQPESVKDIQIFKILQTFTKSLSKTLIKFYCHLIYYFKQLTN